MSLNAFARQIAAAANAIPGNSDALVRKAALAVDQTVVMATPVDTGRARSNWIVTIDQPAQGEVPSYNPGSHGSTGGAVAQQAIDQGKNVISTFKNQKQICITNNLDYIEELNNGSSRQAPASFVEQAVAAGVQAIAHDDILVTDKSGTTRY
jgi:hypothetical protein